MGFNNTNLHGWDEVLDSLPERNGIKGDQIFQNYMN